MSIPGDRPPLTGTRYWVTALPYLWLALFFLAPLLVLLKISLAEAVIGLPPYTELLEWADGMQLLHHLAQI